MADVVVVVVVVDVAVVLNVGEIAGIGVEEMAVVVVEDWLVDCISEDLGCKQSHSE